MSDYKILVDNDAESREVQGLAFKLGFTHDDKSKKYHGFCFGEYPHFINLESDEGFLSASESGLSGAKEVAIEELRKLAQENQNMSNYKIKVNNEAESKEVQELFFELGGDFYFGGKVCCNTHLSFVTMNKDGLMANIELDGFNYKEITLPQLRDMVVLKRNDVNDATHTDQDEWKWYIGEKSYVWKAGNAEQLNQWDESCLDHVDLKPIEKEKMQSYNIQKQAEKHMQDLKIKPKLFLDPTQNYAEIEWDGTTLKGDDWIEVPDGVNYLYKDNEHGNTVFTVLEMGYRDSSIVWQRTQDEPFLTPESVVGSANGGARDWMNERINDKNHKQYTTELIERVKVLEREVKRLAEIEVTKIANCVPPLSSAAGTIKPKPDLSPQNEFILSNEQQRLLVEYPHYYKDVRHLAVVDVYEVLDLFGVTDQAVGHAVKKLLVTGKRGAKGRLQDLIEARDTLSRAIEIQERKANETK